jgi:colanic acid/amylovoran biosynthesis glycosyltransferase
VLIGAVDRLIAAGRRVRLRLVGDGPDRAALERLVAERRLGDVVHFEGAVDADDVRRPYAGADAFALASFTEGIPVVLMEAMAMAIPVVTTWITGIPELVRDGIDGVLVPPADEGALADALRLLMDHPTRRAALGAAGRRRVEHKYALEPNVARLAVVFERYLLAAAPPPAAPTASIHP